MAPLITEFALLKSRLKDTSHFTCHPSHTTRSIQPVSQLQISIQRAGGVVGKADVVVRHLAQVHCKPGVEMMAQEIKCSCSTCSRKVCNEAHTERERNRRDNDAEQDEGARLL